MKKKHWRIATDVVRMFRYLDLQGYSRKLHLVYLGNCRRIWVLLPHEESRKGIEVAERFADGQATAEELAAQDWKTESAVYSIEGNLQPDLIESWVRNVEELIRLRLLQSLGLGSKLGTYSPLQLLIAAAYFADMATCLPFIGWMNWAPIRIPEADLCFLSPAILRDVFGNPWHEQSINPEWLSWRDGTALKLGQLIYDDHRFDLMPILADVLHEAGCCDEAILEHCRGPGLHVRGCWVVDLVLGKS